MAVEAVRQKVGRVAVVDPLPMFRRGLASTLAEAGYDVDCPDDVVAWVGCRFASLLTVLLSVDDDAGLRLLGQLSTGPRPTPVIAVVDPTWTVRAARAGARSVLLRGVDAPVLVRTVEATLDGQSVMPAGVATQMSVASDRGTYEAGQVSDAGARWLRDLAAGATVAQLATRHSFSERAMFRNLKTLYQQMGVAGRLEAIMRARELGLL